MIKTRLLHLIELINSKFWVIPLFCLITSGALAYLNISLDKYYFSFNGEPFSFLFYFNDPQSVRALLTTVAGSLLGVAGVSFSVTITSLVLASQQFGPRLLRNFMKDSFNQLVIGLFIATFLYCMLILQFTSNMEDARFTPVVSMLAALALVVIDLLLLVFYIHHVTESIHADTIISAVYEELTEHLDTQFLKPHEETSHLPAPEKTPAPAIFKNSGPLRKLTAPFSGYLQAINQQALFELAKKRDIALNIHFQAGDYIMKGADLASCLSQDKDLADDLKSEILSHFIVGNFRTPEQDARYAIRQLVEVALRALSPAINDPFTAITCIDRLGSAMSIIMERQLPVSEYYDDEGRLRLQLKPYSFDKLLAAAFDQIRQNTAHHTAVIISLLKTLQQLAEQAYNAEQTQAIQEQADAIFPAAKKALEVQKDLDAVTAAYEQIAR